MSFGGSAEAALRGAVLTALREDVALSAGLNGVFDGPAVKASAPYAELGDLISIDWGTKTAAGREVRVAVTIRDAGESGTRLHRLAEAAGAAIEALPRNLDGWRLGSIVLGRNRVTRAGPGQWTAAIEYRVRMMEDL